jgi:hypothetical protein
MLSRQFCCCSGSTLYSLEGSFEKIQLQRLIADLALQRCHLLAQRLLRAGPRLGLGRMGYSRLPPCHALQTRGTFLAILISQSV